MCRRTSSRHVSSDDTRHSRPTHRLSFRFAPCSKSTFTAIMSFSIQATCSAARAKRDLSPTRAGPVMTSRHFSLSELRNIALAHQSTHKRTFFLPAKLKHTKSIQFFSPNFQHEVPAKTRPSTPFEPPQTFRLIFLINQCSLRNLPIFLLFRTSRNQS